MKAIENNDIDVIKKITANINDPKYVLLSTEVRYINPIQYAIVLKNYDLVIPLLEIAIQQYHPIKGESKTPLSIKNSSINNNNDSDYGSYNSDDNNGSDTEEDDEGEDLLNIMLEAVQKADPISLINSSCLITKYIREHYDLSQDEYNVTSFELLLMNKRIDITEQIYNICKEKKLIDKSFIESYCLALAKNGYYEEYISHFDDLYIYSIKETSDIEYTIINVIIQDIRMIEWFFNPNNKTTEKILKALKSKKYITLKEEEEVKKILSNSSKYLVDCLKYKMNNGDYSCLSSIINLYKEKYEIELNDEEKLQLFNTGGDYIKEENDLQIIISLFMKSFNDYMNILPYHYDDEEKEKEENKAKIEKRKRNEIIMKYFMNNFKNRIDELTVSSLMRLLGLNDKIIQEILPFYKWDKITNYYIERSTTVYHNLSGISINVFNIIIKELLKIDNNGYNIEDYKGLTGYEEILYKLLIKDQSNKMYFNFINVLDCNNKKRVFVNSQQIINGIDHLKNE